MTGIDSWSTTPANNATTDGGAVTWAEGMPPSAVNNTARQCLADVRSLANDSPWFVYGTGDQNVSTHLAVPAVYASGTSFTIAGADVTAAYHIGRRLRAVGVSTGTIYGTIKTTAYAPTTTTVTAQWDSGSLSNETLVVSLSQIPVTGQPISPSSIRQPRVMLGQTTPTGTTSATAVMMGMGGSLAFTPKFSGTLQLTVYGFMTASGAAVTTVQGKYDTGAAPANGDATTGKSFGGALGVQALGAGVVPFCIIAIATGLTIGTAYWIDFAVATNAGTATPTFAQTNIIEV